MKSHRTQTSLSRDFALLAVSILFVLFLITVWISYTTYTKHTEKVTLQLEIESHRIERLLASDIENANYLLTSLGRQIILDKDKNLINIAQILKSFDSRGYIYSVFSFVGSNEKIMVSSNRGIIDEPVDISDRDYVKMAMNEPWKAQIGRPIEGRVSGRWIIPVIMGITDYTGKFIGSILISVDINAMTEQISKIAKRDGLDYAIISKSLIPLTQVSDDKEFINTHFPAKMLMNIDFANKPRGLLNHGNLLMGSSTYTYYRVSDEFPYIILMSYDSYLNDENVRNQLWSRLLQILGFATFFVLFMWIMRARLVRPVLELTEIASNVANGKPYQTSLQGAPIEIEGLAKQIVRISSYIQESARIEDELRNKMFMLKSSKQQAELEKLSKSEFLAYVCQQLRIPLSNLLGMSQVMKDQLYGPIENKKYRQCANDMFDASHSMMGNLDELLNYTKSEINVTRHHDGKSDVKATIKKTLQLLSDRFELEKKEVNVSVEELLPALSIDEFRLQQIFINLILYALQQSQHNTLAIEARRVNESKDKPYTIIIISAGTTKTSANNELIARAHDAIEKSDNHNTFAEDSRQNAGHLNLELARAIIASHKVGLYVNQRADTSVEINLFFS